MKNWISRLFGGADATQSAVTAATPAATSAGTPVPPAPDGARETEQLFWRWLTRDSAGDAPEAARRQLLAELARRADKPGDAADLVPRVPEVIPRLLRSLRDEGVSGAELSAQVARDPVLVAEVIREANSPFYRPAKQVRTIDAAVMVLGQNGLRMLLARVAFRPSINLQASPSARKMAPLVWMHSERCARAAGLLAPGLGADPFEAYLAGLMHDVGLVVALRLLDRIVAAPTIPQDAEFAAAVLAAARELSARIALFWELPPPIGAAILRAGRAGAPPLAEALVRADRLAKLRLLHDAGALRPNDALLAGLDGALAQAFARLAPEAG